MKREWKPGDVATLVVDSKGQVALVVQFNRHGCPEGHAAYPVHAHLDDGDWSTVNDLRPLAVIDPEDHEQTLRLAEAFLAHAVAQRATPAAVADTLVAALREFANPTPPKPDEPTGLGAVVEDAEGRAWLRDYERGALPWRPVEESRVNGRHAPNTLAAGRSAYADIAAVRVLSEGIQ